MRVNPNDAGAQFRNRNALRRLEQFDEAFAIFGAAVALNSIASRLDAERFATRVAISWIPVYSGKSFQELASMA